MDDLKEMLRDKAEEMQLSADIPPALLGRARKRRLATGAVAGMVVAGVALGMVVGVRAAIGPSPRVPIGPTPGGSPTASGQAWRGIFPFTTRQEAEALQRAADQGHQPGLVDARVIIDRFGKERLGWTTVYREESLFDQKGQDGPLIVHISTCEASGKVACDDPAPERAVVTVERLLKPAPFGIWLVTGVEGPAAFTPPTPVPLPSGRLATFLGLTLDGKLVIADSTNGTVYRVLEDGGAIDPADMARSANGAEVYFAEPGGCATRIFEVPAGGGARRDLDGGIRPRPSPDGSVLAYISSAPGCRGKQQLITRDLSTWQKTAWDLGPGLSSIGICDLAWFPDSATLAALACDHKSIYVLDTRTQQGITIDQATRLGPKREGWSLLGYDAVAGGIAVRTLCTDSAKGVCSDVQIGAFVIDPGTGAVITRLHGFLDSAQNEALGLHFDVTGEHVLFLGFLDAVYRRDGSAKPTKIVEGYQGVTW